jgi:hypothetical protein
VEDGATVKRVPALFVVEPVGNRRSTREYIELYFRRDLVLNNFYIHYTITHESSY